MANFYMLVIDPSIVNTATLHAYIKNSPKYFNWWHYLSSAYVLKTNDNLAGTQADIQKNWPNGRYFLIKVDPNHYDGWINQDAYNWFKENVN